MNTCSSINIKIYHSFYLHASLFFNNYFMQKVNQDTLLKLLHLIHALRGICNKFSSQIKEII